jgi:hypothetical protein
MARQLLLAALFTALYAPPLAADILPPGHRDVRHELVLEELSPGEGWTMVVTPVRGFGGVSVIEPGVPFTFSSKYGTRVYALPGDAPVPEDPDAVRALALAVGDLPVAEVSSTPLVSPLTRVLTTLRVVSVEEGRVVLEVVDERRLGAGGLEVRTGLLVATLALVACAGLVALWALRRRARRLT